MASTLDKVQNYLSKKISGFTQQVQSVPQLFNPKNNVGGYLQGQFTQAIRPTQVAMQDYLAPRIPTNMLNPKRSISEAVQTVGQGIQTSGQIMQMPYQSKPELNPYNKIPVLGPFSAATENLVNFVGKLPGQAVESYGKTLSATGREGMGAFNVPAKLKKGEGWEAFENVANLADVTPFGLVAGRLGKVGSSVLKSDEVLKALKLGKITEPEAIKMLKIPSQKMETEQAARVYDELNSAMAGFRAGTDTGQVSMKSSFPDWVPADLRKSSLLQEVSKAMIEDSYPKSLPAQRLYDIAHEEILNRITPPKVTGMEDLLKGMDEQVTPEVNPLIQEAKKYKSAEEFVKADLKRQLKGEDSISSITTDKYRKLRDYAKRGVVDNDPIGTLGEMFKSDRINNIIGEAKDIPVFIVDGKGFNGKFSTTDELLGYRLPRIEMTNNAMHKFDETLMEEAIHANQYLKGRLSKRGTTYNIKDFKAGDYSKDINELLSKEGALNAESIIMQEKIKTKSQLIDIWNQANKSGVKDSLIQEARKYKSADDFVKAQGNPIFRGQESELFALDANRPKLIRNMEGTSFAKTRESASNYGSNIIEGYIPKDKIFTSKEMLPEDLSGIRGEIRKLTTDDYIEGLPYEDIVSKIMGYAKRSGKEAVDLTTFFPPSKIDAEIRILDTSESLKTKSQLTDIWNQANVGEQTTDLITEARKYKSAEEFVKAQGNPVYHGTDVSDIVEKEGFKKMAIKTGVSAFGEGSYFTNKIGDAKGYGEVVKAFLKKDIKLKKVFNADAYKVDTQNLIKEGYDGTILDTGSGSNIVVFDPSNIKTKSQLIDIWNKAQTPQVKLKPIKTEGKVQLKPVERGLTTSGKQAKVLTKPTKALLKGTYKVKSNDVLMGEAKALLTEGGDIKIKDVKNLDQKIAATIQRAIDLDAQGKSEEAANLFNNLARKGTEMGRGVQAFSLLDKMSPEAVSIAAARRINKFNEISGKKIPQLTGQQQKEISTAVNSIRNIPMGRERDIKILQLNNLLNSYIPSTFADKALTVWKAGLLTSLRTHERNLLGNTVNLGAEALKDIPASIVDIALSARTGQRTLTPTIKGLGEFYGAKSRQEISDSLRYGTAITEDLSKLDIKGVNWGKNPLEQSLKKYTDAVFRTLGAEDKPFFNAAFARSLGDQAGAISINTGRSADDILKNPTTEMLSNALKDANKATFKDETKLANLAQSVKRTLSRSEYGKVLGEGLIPFTGVPSSVAAQFLDYSPIGLTKGIARAGKVLTQNVPDLQRQASQEIGRGVMGTGLYGLGAYLVSQGLMTGQPENEDQREQWRLEGKQPNSVFIGGKWRGINSVGPQALALLAGAKYQEVMQGESTMPDFAAALAKDQLEQTFLKGVQGPLQAINDPTRYAQQFVGGVASSVIPNIIKDVSRATDVQARETNTLGDYMKAGIPGLRRTLIPRRDVLGNAIPQEPKGWRAFVDLFNSTEPKNTPIISELSRLNTAGYEVAPSQIGKTQTIGGMKVKLTPEQLDKLEKKSGELLSANMSKVLASPTYQGLSDEKKAKAIKDVVELSRSAAKKSMDLKELAPATFETSSDAPKNALQTIALYGKGIFKDPVGVVNAVSTGQPLRKLRGDAIVLERAQGLSAIDKGDAKTVVDHVIPLSLGGTNDQSNLMVIPEGDNRAKAIVEVYLGKKLSNGEINKKEAQDRMLNWRNEIVSLPDSQKNKANELLSTPTGEEVPVSTVQGSLTGVMQIIDEDGKIKEIDFDKPIEVPEYTGFAEVDKKLKSKFTSAINSRITDITNLYLDGQITAEQANEEILALKGYQAYGTGKSGGKKGKKLSYKEIVKEPKAVKETQVKLKTITPLKNTRASMAGVSGPKVKVQATNLEALRNPNIAKLKVKKS